MTGKELYSMGYILSQALRTGRSNGPPRFDAPGGDNALVCNSFGTLVFLE
jgi:hypothetical protein